MHAGKSRQRGNPNLSKGVICEMSIQDEWLMSRQEINDTRLAHSAYLGNASLTA